MTTEDRPQRRYAKPVVVPDRLELLNGPITGVVNLPRDLKWSGNPRYDLGEPGQVQDLYRAVINEAAAPTDLHTYLERVTLVRLWPDLWLPIAIRQAWEMRFPELATQSHTSLGSPTRADR